MKEFIIKRVLQTIPVLMGLSILVFVLTRVIPRDPVRLVIATQVTPIKIAILEEK